MTFTGRTKTSGSLSGRAKSAGSFTGRGKTLDDNTLLINTSDSLLVNGSDLLLINSTPGSLSWAGRTKN